MLGSDPLMAPARPFGQFNMYNTPLCDFRRLKQRTNIYKHIKNIRNDCSSLCGLL